MAAGAAPDRGESQHMPAKHLEFLIGACGWEHAHWQDVFYPDDLPPDWRLTYYGNEFGAVLVPAGVWARGSSQDVTQWSEDTDESFRFVLELPSELLHEGGGDRPGARLDVFLEQAEPLGERVAGVLVRVPARPSLEYIDALLATLCGAYAIVVEFAPTSHPGAAMRELFSRHPVGLSVRNGVAAELAGAGSLVLAFVDDPSLHGARQLRGLIEQLVSVAAGRERAVLLFDGQPPSIEAMRNAKVIAELLGL